MKIDQGGPGHQIQQESWKEVIENERGRSWDPWPTRWSISLSASETAEQHPFAPFESLCCVNLIGVAIRLVQKHERKAKEAKQREADKTTKQQQNKQKRETHTEFAKVYERRVEIRMSAEEQLIDLVCSGNAFDCQIPDSTQKGKVDNMQNSNKERSQSREEQ